MTQIVRIQFNEPPTAQELEEDMTTALFATECVFGLPRLRLEAAYVIPEDRESCLLETSGEAGEIAARILIGLLEARLGADGFIVERLERTVTGPLVETASTRRSA